MFRVFVVGHNPVIRKGLNLIFNQSAIFEVVGDASTMSDALSDLNKLKPDIIITENFLKNSEQTASLASIFTQKHTPSSVTAATRNAFNHDESSVLNEALDDV